MQYPTTEVIEVADRLQLARWSRFLPSPGVNWIGGKHFNDQLEKEAKKMDRILERFNELGGWSSEISKNLGWG